MITAFQIQFDKLADKVLSVVNTDAGSLSEIEIWRTRHFAKIAKMFDSFLAILRGPKDYVTLCALIRMIYDNWYSFLWIYECSEGEDIKLRYYLYVLDSIKQRKSTMVGMHDDKVEDPRRQRLYDNTMADCKKAKRQYEDAIKSLLLYKDYHGNIRTARTSKDSWRYKDIKATEMEFYSWSALYERISTKETRAFLNYMSQYVHGLYASTLTIVPSNEDMLYVLAEAQSWIITHYVNGSYPTPTRSNRYPSSPPSVPSVWMVHRQVPIA